MEEESTGEKSFIIEQKDSIKLTKNTKGYGWEIKILSLDVDKLTEIDNKLKEKFGDNKQ